MGDSQRPEASRLHQSDEQQPNTDAKFVEPESIEETLSSTTPGLRAFLSSRLPQESDIDDCLQTVAIQAIKFSGEVLPAARRAWLFRVAANEASRYWRQKASTQKMQSKQSDETVVTDSPLDQMIRQEAFEHIASKLQSLPEETQTIIRLKLQENLTFQQISDQLNIPLGTALTRMRRGLATLKESMTELPEKNND